MLKILSWNVNGIRAISRNNFIESLKKIDADIVCLQEIKACTSQLSSNLKSPLGYFSFFNSDQRRGYAGTAVFTKLEPLKIINKIGLEEFDNQGRILGVSFSDFSLLNVYMPHGGRQKENMGFKLKAYSHLARFIKKMTARNIILIGDFNIAHKEIDLARPKQNMGNTMFTPEERVWLDRLIALGFVDSFRIFNKGTGFYSWFPYSYNARERNLGWRIDYAFIAKDLKSKIKESSILNHVKGSDHCPILVRVDL
jgi:exodeoxyribonuclease-3